MAHGVDSLYKSIRPMTNQSMHHYLKCRYSHYSVNISGIARGRKGSGRAAIRKGGKIAAKWEW